MNHIKSIQIISIGTALLFIGIFAFNIWQKDQDREKAIDAQTPRILVQPTDILDGNTNSSDIVYIWHDYQCEGCAKLHEKLDKEIIPALKDTTLFVYKDLPIGNNSFSLSSAVAARCAHVQGKGKQAMNYLFQAGENMSDEYIDKMPNNIPGINEKAWQTCRQDKYIESIIDEARTYVIPYAIDSLPTVIVNKVKINVNDISVENIQNIISD